MIETSASGHRQPSCDIDLVLREDAGNRERVRKVRQVAGRVARAFERSAHHPGMPTGRAPRGELAKPGLTGVVFTHVTKLLVVPLAIERPARGHHNAVTDQELADRAAIKSRGLDRFSVWEPHNRWRSIGQRAAGAVLVGRTKCRKEGASATAIPEQSWTDDAAGVARQGGPRDAIHIGFFVPMTTTKH